MDIANNRPTPTDDNINKLKKIEARALVQKWLLLLSSTPSRRRAKRLQKLVVEVIWRETVLECQIELLDTTDGTTAEEARMRADRFTELVNDVAVRLLEKAKGYALSTIKSGIIGEGA